MSELLYLDTARLGRMSPGAQQAHRDFVTLAGDVASVGQPVTLQPVKMEFAAGDAEIVAVVSAV